MTLSEYTDITLLIQELEREGKVTRTFRRLDPERQQAVLSAIFDEAVESGPQALNIKRVAERAGVAVGSLYQYFGSREGLIDFVIELTTRAVTAGFAQYRGVLASMPLRDGLAAYGAGGMEWTASALGYARFFARAAYGGDPILAERVVRPLAEEMLSMLREMLVQAQARGEIRPDVDIEATSRVLNALTIALYDPQLLPYLNTYFQVAGPGVTAERTLTAALDMILHGIGYTLPTHPGKWGNRR